jgi:hypothetical protein
MRKSIEGNLKTWEKSTRRLCDLSVVSPIEHGKILTWTTPGQQDEVFPSDPKVLLYGWHIFHCLYIVLYGKLDFIQMFRDTEWLLSKDFLIAAEHAGQCAKASKSRSSAIMPICG